MKLMKKYRFLLILVILFESVSYSIGMLTRPAGDGWYETLIKAPLTPPDWAFGVVWPLLYLCMAISVWLIWENRNKPLSRFALTFFAAHMILNWSWNFVFFEFQMILAAFLLLICIAGMVGILIPVFFRIHKAAGVLLIPYLLWVSFAVYLSGFIWVLN